MARILGIETSCDETAAAVVLDGRHVESNVVAQQIEMHEKYGGIMPEMAARLHLRAMVPVLEQTLARAGADWSSLDAVAVTHGPGLAPALLVGLNVAKALAFARRLPLIGVNHLGGHVYANWLVQASGRVPEPRFPLVSLVVSGGHTDLVLVTGHGQYRRLGRTIDDAAGEAFDKVARMLGLGFPGGPPIQRAAEAGDPRRFKLPRAWLGKSYNFSFSGLKTAVLHLLQSLPEHDKPVADVAAAFQEAVVDVLVAKTLRAAEEFGARQVLLAGGVAANQPLRTTMERRSPVPVLVPDIVMCTDNGAMIAAAGHFQFEAGDRAGLDLDAIPALPLA